MGSNSPHHDSNSGTSSKPSQFPILIVLALSVGLFTGAWSARPIPLAVHHSTSTYGSRDNPIHWTRLNRMKVDVNQANLAELDLLPGVGPSLAQRIKVHRDEHGEFENHEDLVAVKGIGDRTLNRMKPFLVAETTFPAQKDQSHHESSG